MDLPRNFKFDVRIRSRLLAKGVIDEAEVGKYLETLEDREASSLVIELPQPALINPEDRPTPPASAPAPSHVAHPAFQSERSAPRSIAPGPLAVDEGWDEDDEDDDEDDEDDLDAEEAEPAKDAATAPKASPPPVEAASEPQEPEAAAEEADDESDDEEATAGASDDSEGEAGGEEE
jgi:hypothetical protein